MIATQTTPYTVLDHYQVVGLVQHADEPYVLKVRDLPSGEKPREKLMQYGPAGLSSAELLAVVWGVGTKREELMAMTTRVLQEYGERAIIHEKDAYRLAQALDIPEAKACQLVACFELGRRAYAVKDGQPRYVRTALQAYEYVRDMARGKKEQLRGLYLNAHYEVIRDEVISVGSMTANIVHPREVFQPAISQGAVAVIVAHNHPSGSLQPTEEDIEVTRQLIAAGNVLAVELLDHLIITTDGYVSVMEHVDGEV
jgi:DNA repair protein RadC